ncbi:MAG: S8 family peptidase [Patescibacteria group bacterium]
MKKIGGFVVAAELAGLLFSPFIPVSAVSPAPEQTGPFVLEVSNQEMADQIPGNQFSIGEHNFVVVDSADTANAWEGNPDVLSVAPQRTRHTTATPNDTYFDLQWHLYQSNDLDIDATDAWDTTTGSTDVVVAVIDSGVDVDHVDLADNIWTNTGETAGNGVDDDGNGFVDDVNGWDFINNDNDPTPAPNGLDDDGDGATDGGIVHGTHVAGLVGAAGNNGVGVSGVTWTVQIMPLRSLDDEGSGTDQSIAEAMEYAANNGANVINLSLGAYGNSTELQAGVDYAQDAGVLVVAAAGNDATDLSSFGFYPACSTDVLGVAATNSADDASSFTNYGGGCVDLAAPGSAILSTLYTDDPTYNFTDDYGYLSGTSMATPVVSGAAALLKAANPTFSDSDITNALTSTTDDIGLTTDYGSGRLNVASALENAITFPTIKAWSNSNKTKQVDSGERTNDNSPYFTWTEGVDPDGIAGYWVSFGKNSSANPANVGTFQTTRDFTPTTNFDGNETSYYLRIKIEDSNGEISNAAASFEYLFDNTVKKPSTIGVELVQGGLRVSWTKVTGEHVTGYEILRSVKNKNNYSSVAEVSKTTTYYVDKTVYDERSYDYKVKTTDSLDNSSKTAKKTKQFHAIERLVVGPGPGHAPVVEVYETNYDDLESSFNAYPSSMTQGVEVAVGDVDGDGVDEIITGTGDGAAPQVRVFEADGTVIGSFYAYDSVLRTGVRVGVADTNKDGTDEIVTVPGPGTTPLVKRFTSTGNHLGVDFYALDGKFLGGAFIAGVDFDNDGKDELAIAAGPGGGAQVTVNDPGTGAVEANFFAYDQYTFKGGIRIAAADTDGADGEEIVTVPAVGTAHVQMFAREPGFVKQLNPGFFAFDTAYNTGFSIGAFDTNQTGMDELIVGSGPDTYSEVVVFNKKGTFYLSLTFPFDDFVSAHVAGGFFRL